MSPRLASFTPRQPSQAGSKVKQKQAGSQSVSSNESRAMQVESSKANAETSSQANDGEPALVFHGRRVVPARLEACWTPVDSMAVSRQYVFAVESSHRTQCLASAIAALFVVGGFTRAGRGVWLAKSMGRKTRWTAGIAIAIASRIRRQPDGLLQN
ncbi:hypothetical protein LI328DRAFT_146015 [Trichoderma asperelloides]|nr:hypothetical protein LI328DRAFT_146015 [Trichoderma asperelloides]